MPGWQHIKAFDTATSDAQDSNVADFVTRSNVDGKKPLDVNVLGPGGSVASTITTDGVTATLSPVLLAAANSSRKSILATNNGAGKLYIGHSDSVTSSGVNMGLLLVPGGSYDDSGPGLYKGNLYGVYDATATTQNISVSERS